MIFPQLYYVKEYMLSHNLKASCLLDEYLIFVKPKEGLEPQGFQEGWVEYNCTPVTFELLKSDLELKLN